MWGIALHWGTNDQIMSRMGGRGGSKNATYNNLDTVNMKLFPNHGKIFSWR